jgi:hypothetical protein
MAEHERAAAELRSAPDDAMSEYNERKAREHDRLAERWGIYATYAEKGLMARHIDNEGFKLESEFRNLHDYAASNFLHVALDENNREVT